jgi:hypothetical protein
MAGGGDAQGGGRGDARASCASPLGTPLQATSKVSTTLGMPVTAETPEMAGTPAAAVVPDSSVKPATAERLRNSREA